MATPDTDGLNLWEQSTDFEEIYPEDRGARRDDLAGKTRQKEPNVAEAWPSLPNRNTEQEWPSLPERFETEGDWQPDADRKSGKEWQSQVDRNFGREWQSQVDSNSDWDSRRGRDGDRKRPRGGDGHGDDDESHRQWAPRDHRDSRPSGGKGQSSWRAPRAIAYSVKLSKIPKGFVPPGGKSVKSTSSSESENDDSEESSGTE